MKLFTSLVLLLGLSNVVMADEYTHQLGNSGYAIRFARIEHADRESPKEYRQAVKLQRKAQNLFAQQKMTEAMEISKKAEVLAWDAYHKSYN
ncbi:MAG: hypothetical protein ACD_73C00442G0004 [uncultured bacterium]|nr:MAG: hypothetical protein ACD_73C00442G0004 [uncultured bacterium]